MLRALFLFGLLFVAGLALVLPGGYQDVAIDDKGVLEAADHATRTLSEKFYSYDQHRLVKILKAKRQVVAGLNYAVDMIVGETECLKTVRYDRECEFLDGEYSYRKCSVVMYLDLMGKHELTDLKCSIVPRDEVWISTTVNPE